MGTRRSWPRRSALACAGALGFALTLSACESKRPPSPRAVASAASAQNPDPDPRRFDAAAAGLAERWQGADSLLPDCTPLLAKPADRASCSATRSAVLALHTAFARGATHAELLPLAATAALSAQRAAQLLRSSGVARLFQEHPRAPIPSASASSAPVASAKPPRPSPPKALPSALVRSQGSQDLDAITAYARIATLGLRHLGVYLQFGPFALRKSALGEVERLAREEPHWAAMRALVAEALLVESNAELRRALERVREQLG